MGFTLATRALCQGLGIKNLYLVHYKKKIIALHHHLIFIKIVTQFN